MQNRFTYPLKTFSLALPCVALAGCLGGPGPQAGFTAPPPPPVAAVAAAPAETARGSIFQVSNGYAGLVTGNRARAMGDMVTITLVESITTTKSTSGDTDRSGSLGITPPTTGPLSFLDPSALNIASEGSFSGGGNASQQSSLSGTVVVTIAALHSNGTAEVVGEKKMSLSQGDEWVQFAGRIRLVDIDAQNSLPSSKVANARIIYSGKGAVQQASRPGWLSRFFNSISPF